MRRKLDRKHWKGKYTIHHNVKKLDDRCAKYFVEEYWFNRQLDKWTTEEIRAETVLPKELPYLYYSSITEGLAKFDPKRDEYGYPIGIGYIVLDRYK